MAISVHNIADGQAEAVEFIADEKTQNCGVPLKNMKLVNNVIIACIKQKFQMVNHISKTEILLLL